jgi:CheY-like chemotaxis protein
VLVVEDDPRDQAFLVRTLTSAGYAIETVASATQALESLRARRFDAVTLDVLLPDVSGLDLLREIRRDPAHAKIPVVVVTVNPDRAEAAGLAVDEYLTKPIEASALLDALGRLGVRAERGSVLVVDDDPTALRLMQATLEQAGYHPICESDAERALELCLRTPPAAFIVDLLMPRVDGFEFIERLRRLPSLRHVPVIVWSAKTINAEEHARLRTRSDAIVRKGSAAPLLEELRALMPVHRDG